MLHFNSPSSQRRPCRSPVHSRHRTLTQTLYLGYACVVGCIFFATQTAADAAVQPMLDSNTLGQWETKQFFNLTDYKPLPADQPGVLQANTNGSASGLVRRVFVDLNKTPYLTWSWQLQKLPNVVNERNKKGDDFAARVYVIVSGGMWFWRTVALNYVHSQQSPVNTFWPNPFTKQAVMWAVDTGDQKLGQWHSFRRNVRADLQQAFGREFDHIDGVAIMTDADNSQSTAAAIYGPIQFSDH